MSFGMFVLVGLAVIVALVAVDLWKWQRSAKSYREIMRTLYREAQQGRGRNKDLPNHEEKE